MPERMPSKEQLHNRNHSLWQFVLLLVILAVLTATLVGTCFYRFVHRNDYEISLYQGLVSSAQSSAKTTKSSVSKLSGSRAKSFNFKVSDDETVWKTETSIELFQTSYSNEKGEITVQSADGNNVIAPGTGGSYTFSLKNAGKLDSNYQVWLSADMNVSSSDFPIEFRMSGPSGWITTADGAWETADELNSAVAHKNLYSGKSDEYTLYWRWAFERNADEEDTAFGSASAGQNTSADASAGNMQISQTISYKVTLHTLASEGLINTSTDTDNNAGDKNTDKETQQNLSGGNNTADSGENAAQSHGTSTSRKAAKTGDDTVIWTWLLLIVLAAAVLMTVGYRKGRLKADAGKDSDREKHNRA